MSYAYVAIPAPLDYPLLYKIPENLKSHIQKGTLLNVPFRKKEEIGFCVGFAEELPRELQEKDLKEILSVREPNPVFSERMLSLIQWLSSYYMTPIGEVCRSSLPPRLLQGSLKNIRTRLAEEDHATFHENEKWILNTEQQKALEQILKFTQENPLKPILLHGITSSGKTEIYLQLIQKTILEGRQVILLVPEIGLTPQLIGRVESRLQSKIAIFHSGLSEAWRHAYWESMRKKELQIVVGTRSALFAPFPNLGLIIVDEEHDPTYKQSEGSFLYHARDAAIVRAQLEGVPLILGSATPSMESVFNAKKGKYHYLSLSKRATGIPLPEVSIIDLRAEKFVEGSQTLSSSLKEAIHENLYRQEQTLLFLNRRGFANFLICEDCGYTPECSHCAIALTYHKGKALLCCHYCDAQKKIPFVCPACQGSALKPVGQGTERLEEELKILFPSATILRLDRDTALNRETRHKTLYAMKRGKVDILIGTQMIAKGHDFPNVTLVGVICADTSFHFPDFRSAERTFQMLVQVSGRAGRKQKRGKVLIQTFHPDHISLQCSQNHDFESFFQKELSHRKMLHYPPFTRLIQMRLQGSKDQEVETCAKHLKTCLTQWIDSKFELLGPVSAPLSKLRGKYRWQMLFKTSYTKQLKPSLLQAKKLAKEEFPSVAIQIDVDCIHMM